MRKSTSRHWVQILSWPILSLCFLLFVDIESRAQSGQTNENRRGTTTAPQSDTSAPVECPIPSEFSRLFFGDIGGKEKLQIILTRKGEELDASSYPRLSLLYGSIDQNGYVKLETDSGFRGQGFRGFRGWLKTEVEGGHTLLRLTGELTGMPGDKAVSLVLVDRYDLGDGLSLVTARKHKESERHRYVVDLVYPQMEPMNNPVSEEFNRTVQARVDKQFNCFISPYERIPETRDRSDATEDSQSYGESSLMADWQLASGTSKFVSILFRGSDYGDGAAHSIEYVSAFNYDVNAAKTVDLGDFFLEGSNYLKVISDYCLVELAADNLGDEKWRKKGAGPEERNYQSWVVVPEGFRIHFNPYQVASYAAGEQIVVVPYSVFERILKPAKRWIFESISGK